MAMFLLHLFSGFFFTVSLSSSFPSVCYHEVMGWRSEKPNLHNHLLNSEGSCDKHQLTVAQDNLTEVNSQTLQRFGTNSKTIHMEKM